MRKLAEDRRTDSPVGSGGCATGEADFALRHGETRDTVRSATAPVLPRRFEVFRNRVVVSAACLRSKRRLIPVEQRPPAAPMPSSAQNPLGITVLYSRSALSDKPITITSASVIAVRAWPSSSIFQRRSRETAPIPLSAADRSKDVDAFDLGPSFSPNFLRSNAPGDGAKAGFSPWASARAY